VIWAPWLKYFFNCCLILKKKRFLVRYRFTHIPGSLSYPDPYNLGFCFATFYVSSIVGSGDNCARVVTSWPCCVQKLSAGTHTRDSFVQISSRLVPCPKLLKQPYVCLRIRRWRHGVTSNCFPYSTGGVVPISFYTVLERGAPKNVSTSVNNTHERWFSLPQT